MTTTLTRDRNYYRMCDNDSLINMGRDSMDELCIALAERLAEITDLEDERDALRDALDNAREQIDHLRDALDEAKDEIERLDAVINDANLG
jgi:chromosome segregation ATPase